MTPEAAFVYLCSSLYGMPKGSPIVSCKKPNLLYRLDFTAAPPESRSNYMCISLVRHGFADAISVASYCPTFNMAPLYRLILKNVGWGRTGNFANLDCNYGR